MGKGKQTLRTKTISFTEDVFEVYDYLQTKDNASKYICRLIKQDMTGQSSNDVRRIVEQVLSERGSINVEDNSILEGLQDLFN